MKQTRIILIRHGEPEASARGKCYGKLDVGLSDKGKSQVSETAEFLAKVELTAVYASPRIRAVDSAKVIAAAQNLFVEIEPDLAEIDFGDFEGLEYAEVERRFPALFRLWMDAPTTVQFPNGESFAQMQARVLAVIENLIGRHRGETFAVVSHGGVNRIVLAHFLRIADADIFRLEQNYAAANVLEFYDDFAVAKIINHNFTL